MGDARVTRQVLVRAILVYAAAVNALIAVWALVSPRGWYDGFPGFGRVWVAVDGPYNEHLVRDVGAWALALALVCAIAAVTLRRELVLAAGVALAAQSTPHLVYHLSNLDPYPATSDRIASLGGIALLSVLGVVIAVVAWRAETPLPGRKNPGIVP